MNFGLLNQLDALDRRIMAWIGKRFGHPRLAPVMRFLSHPPYLRELAMLVLLALFIAGARTTRIRVGFLVLGVALSDQTCNIVKMIFKRARPDGREPKGGFWQRLGQYSLPSSHAANNFCLAVMIAHWVPAAWLPLFTWSVLVAFSRVWLKNHYPFDVMVGALIGAGYGFLLLNAAPFAM